MRFLHVVHQYLPEKVGGTELYTQMLAQQQINRGHVVAIFTPATNPAEAMTIEAGVRVHRVAVGARSAGAVFRNNFRQPNLSAAFESVLKTVQPDLVHIQHLMGLPWDLVKHITVPYVVTLHDYWFLCANAQLFTNYDNTVCAGPQMWLNCGRCLLARGGSPSATPLALPLTPMLGYRHLQLRHILNNACLLIAPTQFTRDIHVQMGIDPQKIVVVDHGIDAPTVMPPRKVSDGGLRVVYIGGLSRQKGVHVLVTAVNDLPLEVSLILYGDMTAFPDYVNELQELAHHPGIKFAGRIPHKQLWEALAEADVVVVPSLWYETAVLVIQEAFAAGVPVIASQIGALQERVNDGSNGLLFPPGDAAALRDILLNLHDSPVHLAALRRGITAQTTIDQHLDKIIKIYQSCLDQL